MATWDFPYRISEVIADEALKIEKIRRKLIDLYLQNSYELVMLPIVGFADFTNDSFKFNDNQSDNTLEIIADITPKIAIIDAKYKKNTAKYCYINQITKPYADDFYSSRNPIQVGAEIYGDKHITADFDIITLMIKSLLILDKKNITITISNIAVFNNIIKYLTLDSYKAELIDIFIRKSIPDLISIIKNNNIRDQGYLTALINNDITKINKDICIEEIDKVKKLAAKLSCNVVCDFSDINAYTYHSGIIFSAYHKNYTKAIARGGRYDDLINNRAATGFSFDLKFLL